MEKVILNTQWDLLWSINVKVKSRHRFLKVYCTAYTAIDGDADDDGNNDNDDIVDFNYTKNSTRTRPTFRNFLCKTFN